MVVELPTYLSLVADVAPTVDVLDFWQAHVDKMPAWGPVVANLYGLTHQVSSGAAQLVSSVLTWGVAVCYGITWEPTHGVYIKFVTSQHCLMAI